MNLSTWQKSLWLLLLPAALIFESCKTPLSTTTTIIQRDTVTQIDFISTIEPCEIDTSIILYNHGRLDIKGTNEGLVFSFFPEPTEVKIVEVLTNKSFKQREKTLRAEFRQREKTLRDSMDAVSRVTRDSLKYTMRALADTTQALAKYRAKETKAEVRGRCPSVFTTLFIVSFFVFIAGLIVGLLTKIQLKKNIS